MESEDHGVHITNSELSASGLLSHKRNKVFRVHDTLIWVFRDMDPNIILTDAHLNVLLGG